MKKTKKAKALDIGHLKATIRVLEADNPEWSQEHDGIHGNPRKIMVHVNIRESAIGTMAARGLLDETQIMAASRLRKILEAAGSGGARAIDYTREQVDGSGPHGAFLERAIDAAEELARVRPLLGIKIYGILRQVVEQGAEIKDLADSHRRKNTTADYIRDGLDVLAEHWHLGKRRA